jgi:hypothetical protein
MATAIVMVSASDDAEVIEGVVVAVGAVPCVVAVELQRDLEFFLVSVEFEESRICFAMASSLLGRLEWCPRPTHW